MAHPMADAGAWARYPRIVRDVRGRIAAYAIELELVFYIVFILSS